MGAVKHTVALNFSIISIIFGGDAFSSKVAAAPKRSGKIARPPRPKVNASGGEPTKMSVSITFNTSFA